MILPGELYPDYPHIVGAAPTGHPGTAAELISLGPGHVVSLFRVDASCVGQAFRENAGFISGYFAAGATILFLCQTRRDRAEATRRLKRIVPDTHTVRT